MDVDATDNGGNAQRQKLPAEDFQNGLREPHVAEGLSEDGNGIEIVARCSPAKVNGISKGEPDHSAVAIAIKNKTPSPQKESAKKQEMSDSEIEDGPVGEFNTHSNDVQMSEDVKSDDGIDGMASILTAVPIRGKCLKKIVTLKTIQRTTVKLEYYVDGVLAFETSKTEDDKERESTERAEFQTVTDEVFETERARLKKASDRLPAKNNLKKDPSEAGSDVGVRIGGRKLTRRAITSDDDDDDSVICTPLGQASQPSQGRSRGSSRRSIVKDDSSKPSIVLAKYHLDNNYYPARWYPGKKSSKGPTFCVVKFLDAKEEMDVQRSSLYQIKEWMTEGRQIMVKIGDADYEDNATILKVTQDEGQPPSYLVKMEAGQERIVKLDKVALSADEHLKAINDDKQPVDMDSYDVDKAFKMNGNDKTVVPSLIDSMTKKPVNQRSSERASTRLRIDSPSKAASEKKAPKPSAKKPKLKEPTPEPEEESAPRSGSILTEDPSVLYRIGNNQFHKGEKVFAMWEDDKRWYSAKIGGVRQSKLRIDWCENDQINYVSPDEIIREKDILKKGLRVNVIAEGKAYYDEMIFTEYMEDGEHLMQTKKGVITPKSFNVMMIQADEVKRWKKAHGSAGGTAVKSGRPSGGVTSTSKKRPRTPTPEPTSAGEEKSSKRSSKAKPEGTKESSPVAENSLPFANSAFIITSGADKDATFERDYIVKKVEELGGAVLNTFEDLASSAGKRYLVAPTACRTAKFLQCLAANIPCVSHKWILEIAEKNGRKLLNFEAHRLPAGKSSQSNKMINWTPRKTLLDNLRVGLYGGPGFRATWLPAFKAGKAEPTVLEEKDVNEANIGKLDVVIVEDVASSKLVQTCNDKNVGLVTVEWIIQTLIHGIKQNYDFWPYQNLEGAN